MDAIAEIRRRFHVNHATITSLSSTLTTYQFIKTAEKPGKGLSFCKHRFKYRKPRVNQETMLRRSFLKHQCAGSACCFVFFERCRVLHRVMVADANTPVHG